MNIRFITTASDRNNPGVLKLEKSLIHYGWDYTIVEGEYLGFGSKLIGAYEFLRKVAGNSIDLIIYGDSYDSFMTATPEEVLKKYKPYHGKALFSAELSCWPDRSLVHEYPVCDTPYRFLNGGGWICSPRHYMDLMEMEEFSDYINDQERHTNFFLNRNDEARIVLDTKNAIFQTLGHTKPEDFNFHEGRLFNKITREYPCLIHGNGNTFNTETFKSLNLI